MGRKLLGVTSSRTAALKLIVFLLAGSAGSGQPPAGVPVSRPQFDVASVRENKASTAAPAVRITPGRFTVESLRLRRLILVAYKIRDFQISNSPGWISSERYGIDARTDGANGADAMLQMLKALLADRFHLRFHHEMKEGPVYVLTIAKNGSKMHEARCVPLDPNNLPKQARLSGNERASQCGGIKRSDGELDGNGMTMEDGSGPAFQSLAGQLSLILDRPVINRTGLTARFDVHLRWNAYQPANALPNQPGDSHTPLLLSDLSGASIFTTIQEQLGLKLEAGEGPIDYFVIDHVEKPSEN